MVDKCSKEEKKMEGREMIWLWVCCKDLCQVQATFSAIIGPAGTLSSEPAI